MHFGAVMLYESPKWLLDCIIFGSGSRRLRHSHLIQNNKIQDQQIIIILAIFAPEIVTTGGSRELITIVRT